jgi:hypothetical protein
MCTFYFQCVEGRACWLSFGEVDIEDGDQLYIETRWISAPGDDTANAAPFRGSGPSSEEKITDSKLKYFKHANAVGSSLQVNTTNIDGLLYVAGGEMPNNVTYFIVVTLIVSPFRTSHALSKLDILFRVVEKAWPCPYGCANGVCMPNGLCKCFDDFGGVGCDQPLIPCEGGRDYAIFSAQNTRKIQLSQFGK